MDDRGNDIRQDDAIEKTLAAHDTRSQHAQWLQNIRANLAEIKKGRDISRLSEVFAGIPGIVAGAGPSLEKNAGLLKDVQMKYPVFCCDRALKRMTAVGVYPQIAVVADASDETASFFEDIDLSKITLIAPAYSSPAMLRLNWRKKVFYNVTDDVDKGYESAAINMTERRISAIPGGVVVGNMAMLAAKIAGCAPITFIGNDLSMTEPSEELRKSGKLMESEGKNGEKLYSIPGFLAAFEWLIKFADDDPDVKSGRLKLYNSTEGGIMYSEKIEGLPLAEFLLQYKGTNKSLNTLLRSMI